MILIVFCFIFMWLLPQWANGATLWESIAPHEPVMATIWIIFIGFLLMMGIGKIHETLTKSNEAPAKEVAPDKPEFAQGKTNWELNEEMKDVYRKSFLLVRDFELKKRKYGATPEEEARCNEEYRKLITRYWEIIEYLQSQNYRIEYVII